MESNFSKKKDKELILLTGQLFYIFLKFFLDFKIPGIFQSFPEYLLDFPDVGNVLHP